jgi:hypothetical protein
LGDQSLETHGRKQANLSPDTAKYLAGIGSVDTLVEMLFGHTVAILHSSSYSRTNATALRQGWPRIPLPASREMLI